MDFGLLEYGDGWGDELVLGLGITLGLAILAIVFGTAIGLFSALVERSKVRSLSGSVSAFNAVVRSLPELLIILFVYYGSSILMQAVLSPFGIEGFISISAFSAGVIALSLIHTSYASEVFRGAFAAVPTGPVEAARSLGLHPLQQFFLVQLPLAIRFAFPGLVNLSIVTLKTTPLVSAIGLQDLIRVAGDAGQNTREYLTFFILALVIYLLIAGLVMIAQFYLEKRLFQFMYARRS